MKHVLEILLDGDEVEQAPSRFEANEKVQIASGTFVAPRARPEHANGHRAVSASDASNLGDGKAVGHVLEAYVRDAHGPIAQLALRRRNLDSWHDPRQDPQIAAESGNGAGKGIPVLFTRNLIDFRYLVEAPGIEASVPELSGAEGRSVSSGATLTSGDAPPPSESASTGVAEVQCSNEVRAARGALPDADSTPAVSPRMAAAEALAGAALDALTAGDLVGARAAARALVEFIDVLRGGAGGADVSGAHTAEGA